MSISWKMYSPDRTPTTAPNKGLLNLSERGRVLAPEKRTFHIISVYTKPIVGLTFYYSMYIPLVLQSFSTRNGCENGSVDLSLSLSLSLSAVCAKLVGVRRFNFQILLFKSYILVCKMAIKILF